MDIREFKSLLTLSRTGSLSRTAEAVHLTPSAIHRHLKILSEDLGIQLYERHNGALRLTNAAVSLMPLVEELMTQYEAILAAAQDLGALRRGTVRIASGPTFGSYVLAGVLEEFRKLHPQIDVYLEAGHTTQLLAELQDGTIDLVFLIPKPGIDKTFVIEAMWTFEVPIVTTRRYYRKGGTPLRQLAGLPFLLYKQGSFFEEQIDRYLTSHDFSPEVAMRLDNAYPIKAMVKSGFGVSLLPAWVVREEIRSGELLHLRVKEEPLTCRLALIRRRSNYVSAATAAMIELARQADWTRAGMTRTKFQRNQ